MRRLGRRAVASRDRHLGLGFGGGLRGQPGAAIEARPADRLRASTPQIRKLYERLSGLDLAARRKVTGIGPKRAEIIVPGVSRAAAGAGDVPSALHVLFGRGRARRHHRRPGGARRGARTGAVEPRSAQGSGADGAALRRLARARARGGGDGADRCSPPRSRCTSCRRSTGGCWRRPPTCTTSAITSATPGITSIPITWWRTRICRASPTGSAS